MPLAANMNMSAGFGCMHQSIVCLSGTNATSAHVMLQVMPEAVDETVQVKGSYSIGKAEEM